MLYCLLIPLAAIAAAVIASHIYRGRELTPAEILDIAQQMRIAAIWDKIQWSQDTWSSEPLRDTKKRMKSAGGIHECNADAGDFVAFAAALLKHKKHEWFIVGWAANRRVSRYWCNKGPDSTMVIPGLGPEEMAHAAKVTRATVVYDLHNHPNPSPQRLDCSQASAQDLESSRQIGKYLAARGLAYVAFVVERGTAYPYAVFVPEGWAPFSEHLDSVKAAASMGSDSRRALRIDHSLRVATTGCKLAKRFVHNLSGHDDDSRVA